MTHSTRTTTVVVALPTRLTTVQRTLLELHESRQLVVRAVRYFQRFFPQADPGDVESLAQQGLIDAVRRYEHGRGSFAAYAWRRVRGYVLDELKRDWLKNAATLSSMAEYARRMDKLKATSFDATASQAWDEATRNMRLLVHELVYAGLAAQAASSPEQRLLLAQERKRTLDALEAAVATLSQDDRALLSSIFVEGMTIKALARARDADRSTVRRHRDRILTQLYGELVARGFGRAPP